VLTELYLSRNELAQASQVIDQHLQVNPSHSRALIHKAVIALQMQDFTQAETTLAAALRHDGKNVQALLTQSALFIQTQRYAKAIESVDRVLAIDPQNQAALLNRAIARLQNGDLDAAKQDYLVLHQRLPELYTIHFGLGEIAWQQSDAPSAIQFYRLYLQHARPDTEEAKQVAQRLQQLQP
jgi:tetratricopeptide (TPR) repeat protein